MTKTHWREKQHSIRQVIQSIDWVCVNQVAMISWHDVEQHANDNMFLPAFPNISNATLYPHDFFLSCGKYLADCAAVIYP